MEHSIQNEFFKVTVSQKGAELQSIRSADGTEYLWQGDPAFWEGRAPTLFPYVGRLTRESYTYDNKLYHMEIHGFAPNAQFRLTRLEPSRMGLLLSDSAETLEKYPFHFAFEVEYALEGNRLTVTYRVENRDSKTMYFGLGGHPGFRVPLEPGKKFDDYYLEFAEPCLPDQVQFSEACFITGEETPFPLENDRILRLRHDMFDHDALFFKKTAGEVKLCCDGGKRSVTMGFPGLPVLGIWHWPHTEAPYVCIEPWSSLPSKQDEVTDLQGQKDLISLEAGETYETAWYAELN